MPRLGAHGTGRRRGRSAGRCPAPLGGERGREHLGRPRPPSCEASPAILWHTTRGRRPAHEAPRPSSRARSVIGLRVRPSARSPAPRPAERGGAVGAAAWRAGGRACGGAPRRADPRRSGRAAAARALPLADGSSEAGGKVGARAGRRESPVRRGGDGPGLVPRSRRLRGAGTRRLLPRYGAAEGCGGRRGVGVARRLLGGRQGPGGLRGPPAPRG